MPNTQLSITESYDYEVIQQRKQRIRKLTNRAESLYTQWRNVFGTDTPVAIDRGYHHTMAALETIQTETATLHIEEAEKHLEDAAYFLNHEAKPYTVH